MLDEASSKRVVAALLALQSAENPQTLRTEGAQEIKDLLGCSIEKATAIIEHYENRIVKIGTDMGGAVPLSSQERLPVSRLKWVAIKR
jgi:hypothetical protein